VGECRKLRDWIIECGKQKKKIHRALVLEEALRIDASIFGGII